MAFDISTLKEKLDEEQFSALRDHVSALQGQMDRQKTRAEAAKADQGGISERAEKLAADLERALEKLGVASVDEIDFDAPTAKKTDDSATFEAKMKRLAKKLEDADRIAGERQEKLTKLERKLALNNMLSTQKNLAEDAQDLVREYFENRLVNDAGEWCVKSADGSLLTQEEGLSEFIESHPSLVRAGGQGGSGYSEKIAARLQTVPFNEMTTTQKAKLWNEDRAAFETLKNQAEGN